MMRPVIWGQLWLATVSASCIKWKRGPSAARASDYFGEVGKSHFVSNGLTLNFVSTLILHTIEAKNKKQSVDWLETTVGNQRKTWEDERKYKTKSTLKLRYFSNGTTKGAFYNILSSKNSTFSRTDLAQKIQKSINMLKVNKQLWRGKNINATWNFTVA